MNNFAHATDATKTALESQGSAMRENSAYMDSIEAKQTALNASFQEFANNVISSGMVKGVLDLVNGFMQLANTDIGRFTSQILLMTGVGWGAVELVKVSKLLPTITTQFKTLAEVAGAAGAAGGITSLSDAFAALQLAGGAALPIILSVATVLAVGGALWKATEDSRKSIQELSDDIDQASDKLETNKQRLKEIEELPWTQKTPDILDEYDALKQENDELERNIKLLQEKKTGALVKEARSGGQIQQDTTYGFTGLMWSTNTVQEAWETMAATLGMAGESIEDVKKRAAELGYTLQENAVMVKVDADAYNQDLVASMQSYIEQLNSTHEVNQDQIRDFDELKDKVSDRVDGLKQLQAQGYTLTESELNLISTYDALTSAEAEATDFTNKFGDAQQLTAQQANDLIKAFPEVKNQITQVGEAYYYTGNGALQAANEIFDANGNIVTSEKSKVDGVIAQLKRQLAAYAAVVEAKRAAYGSLVKSGLKDTELGKQAEAEWTSAARAWDSIRQAQAKVESALATGRVTYTGKTGIDLGATDTSAKKGKTGTKSSTKKQTDEALTAFNNYYKDLQHLRDMDEIDDEQYYERLQGLVDDYKKKATANMKAYGLNTETINRNMYQYVEEIYNGLEKVQKASLEKQKSNWEDYLESLQEQKSNMDAVIDYASEYASRQISAIEEELDNVQDEIDAINAKWDKQLSNLETANDELDKQIQKEKLLEALASAKSTQKMIYKDGQFQYVEDVDEVSQAQTSLDEFNRQQALEDQKAFIEQQRQNELIDWQNKQAALEAEKQQWEDYRDGWQNLTKDYQYEQNRLIATQQEGIDIEKGNWATRLEELETFKNSYISKLNEIQAAQEQINALSSQISSIGTTKSSGSGSSGGKYSYSFSGTGGTQYASAEADPGVVGSKAWKSSGGGKTSSSSSKGKSKISSIVKSAFKSALSKHANGTLSATEGLSLVGENGPELRVLGNNDGIIPADVTRNLWDWGKINPASSGVGGSSYIINIDNLSLPNAKDAQSLVDGLKRMAYQRAYKRA